MNFYGHESLIRSIVSRFNVPERSPLTKDDLTQVAIIELMFCLGRFDPAKGVKFQTFAYRRIMGAVQDELRNADWVSRSDRRRERESAGEFVPSKIEALAGCVETITDENSPLADLICSEVRLAILELPYRLRMIIKLKYEDGVTFKEMGKQFGVSESRAFQLHDMALKMIRKRVR